MSRLAALAGEPNAESAGMSRVVIGWCAKDRSASVKGDDETETGKQGRGTGALCLVCFTAAGFQCAGG